jgi:hypothetical protein
MFFTSWFVHFWVSLLPTEFFFYEFAYPMFQFLGCVSRSLLCSFGVFSDKLPQGVEFSVLHFGVQLASHLADGQLDFEADYFCDAFQRCFFKVYVCFEQGFGEFVNVRRENSAQDFGF